MRMALFGGSFDPPHLAHLRIARAALERLALDRVLFAPTGRQPLKRGGAAGFEDRLAMVDLLLRGETRFAVSAIDAPRERAPNYTVDTVARLRPSLPKGAELFFLAGADSFLSLAHWRDPGELLAPGRLFDGWILAARPGFPLSELGQALPCGFALGPERETPGPVVRYAVEPGGMPLYVLPDLDDPASATGIRAAIAEGAPAPALPPSIAAYIREQGLYRTRQPSVLG